MKVYNRCEVILLKQSFFFLSYLRFFLLPHQVTLVNNLVCFPMYFSTCQYNLIKAFINIVDLGVNVWQKWVTCMSCSRSCFSLLKIHQTLYTSIIFHVVSYCLPKIVLLLLKLSLYIMWEVNPTFSPQRSSQLCQHYLFGQLGLMTQNEGNP